MTEKKKKLVFLLLPLILGYGVNLINPIMFFVMRFAFIIAPIFLVFWFNAGSFFGGYSENKLKAFLLGNSIWVISFVGTMCSEIFILPNIEFSAFWAYFSGLFSAYASLVYMSTPYLVPLLRIMPSFDGRAFADFIATNQYILHFISFTCMFVVFGTGFIYEVKRRECSKV